ncbi:CocE/NonD family hydrolase [Ketobacter alkanivorans]|uniref:Acyl esterase n=1 Tax=Ketobacter alkanivorans TaxID=1917421 RepID=A0A2K9LLB5_9GAMM|nr:CocE/NonD family hydrolase [Ketobacter alkanivorans]AUM13072.1 acyl esterase [Ketobacter alkanivorans]
MERSALQRPPVGKLHLILITLLLAALSACGGGSSGGDSSSTDGSRSLDSATTEDSTDTENSTPGTTGAPDDGETGSDASNADTPRTGAYTRDADYPRIKVGGLQYIPSTSGHNIGLRVTLPADADGNPAPGPFPVILVQSAYNINLMSFLALPGAVVLGAPDPFLVRRGYAIVGVDVIGGGVSEGGWEMLGAEEQSGYGDVVDWIKQQPWYDGNLGVAGASYMAITGLFTAQQRPDDIKAIFASVPMGDSQRGTVGTGGMLNAVFMSEWMTLTHLTSTQNVTTMLQFPKHMEQIAKATSDHIAQIDNYYLPLVDRVLDGDPEITYDSEFWRTRSPIENMDKITAPTIILGALNDIFQRDAPLLYESLKDRVDTRLVIYNGSHISNFLQAMPGTESTDPSLNLLLQWFDKYLKGMDTQTESIPPVTQYVKNYKHGIWQGFATTTDWPHPAAMPQRWYLRGDMSLRQEPALETETTHSMEASPSADYVFGKSDNGGLLRVNLTLNDGTECSPSYEQWTLGAAGIATLDSCFWDNRELEQTALNYETAPMTEDYYINGPIQADLWISSTHEDAVISVRIDEVTQSGRVAPITNGLLLASARQVNVSRSRFLDGEMIQPYHYFTQEAETFLVPGEVTKVQVEIFSTSALIREGNRLRVSISPSNQAQGMLNLPRRAMVEGGTTTIHNSSEHPSSVVLPIVPTSELN